MTSVNFSANKKSASYDLRRAFKQNIAPAIAMLFVLSIEFIWSPLITLISYADGNDAILTKSAKACVLVTDGSLNFACIFIGIIFALTNFYIMSKPSVNFHLSLPVDRGTLFKNRFIVTSLTVAAAVAVTLGTDVLLNVAYLGNAAFILKMALGIYLEAVVGIMAIYTILTLAVFSCYTVVEGLFFGAALLVLPTVLLTSLDGICSALLNGYARSNDLFNIYLMGDIAANPYQKVSFLALFAVANPLIFDFVVGKEGGIQDIFSLARNGYSSTVFSGMGDGPEDKFTGQKLPTFEYFIPIIVWIILIALLALLAKKLFVNRKSEKTSIHSSNPIPVHVFAFLFSSGLSYCVGYNTFLSVDSAVNKPVAIAVFTAIFAVSYLIILAINKRQAVFKNKKAYAIVLGFSAAAVILQVILATGGLGYTAYAPKAEDIKYAAVTNCSIVEGGGSIDSQIYDSYPALGITGNTTSAILEDKDDIKTFIKAKDKMLNYKNKTELKTEFSVVYLTNSGKKIYRTYKVPYSAAQETSLVIANSKAYKNEMKSLINAEDQTEFINKLKLFGLESDFMNVSGLNEFVNYIFKNGKVKLEYFGSAEEIDFANTPELRKALAEDLANLDAADRLRPEEKELCRIRFYSQVNQDVPVYDEKYDYSDYIDYGERVYIVYPSMKNTVDYLKANVKDFSRDSYFINDVTEVYVTTVKKYSQTHYNNESRLFMGTVSLAEEYEDNGDVYNNFQNIEGVFSGKPITDKAEIEKLKSVARPFGLLNDDDYVVAFKTRNSDAETVYQFMCVYKEDYK